MIKHYKKSEFEEKFSEVEGIDKKTEEFFFKYMMLIMSFGRPVRLSQRGYDKGMELYKKWKEDKESLTREENMLLGFVLSDISVMEENKQMMSDLGTIYNQMVTKYKPDFQYMQEFSQKHILELGCAESNPNYMLTVEQMFTKDFVLPNAEQMRMVTTGEMPIYDDVKACPYCGKQFGKDSVEDLFKHVKSEHDKK